MRAPLTEDLLLPLPEEPWWWPLGPTGFVVAMFAGVTWISWTWPIMPGSLEILRGWLKMTLAALFGGWLVLAVWLRRRRTQRELATLRVRLGEDSLQLGERRVPWSEIQGCEWSPFGLVLTTERGPEHIHARITDAQVTRLQLATPLTSG